MIKMKGRVVADCKIFTDEIDEVTRSQIQTLLDEPSMKDLKFRFQSDVHAGAGAVIGTTIQLPPLNSLDLKIIPNIVGCDISCGVTLIKLDCKKENLNFTALDLFLRTTISKRENRPIEDSTLSCFGATYLDELKSTCKRVGFPFEKALSDAISIGGGNHYAEVGEDSEQNIYISIHSGSRGLGGKIASYYQKLAYAHSVLKLEEKKKAKQELIENLKMRGEHHLIQFQLNNFDKAYAEAMKFKDNADEVTKGLEFIEGHDALNYLTDMQVATKYASKNRILVIGSILNYLSENGSTRINAVEAIESTHNYIDTQSMILRKGSISAQKGEKILLPLNMAEGILICEGKGNPDWNYSAPHGLGRLFSRTHAKDTIQLSEFSEAMSNAGVWSTCITEDTIDESPMAYKKSSDVLKHLDDTLIIIKKVKPLYNYKEVEYKPWEKKNNNRKENK